MGLIKKIQSWFDDNSQQRKSEFALSESKKNFVIIRVNCDDGSHYDAIELYGIQITTKEDSGHITDKLAELREMYIQHNVEKR